MIEIIADFLNNTIDIYEYATRLHGIRKQVDNLEFELNSDFKKLQAFEPDLHSEGFTRLFFGLLSDFEMFEDDPELIDEDCTSLEDVLESVEVILSRIQKY